MSFLINESRRLCGIPQYYSTDCGRSKYGDGIFRQRDRGAAGKLMDIYAMYYIHEDEIGSVAFDVWAIHNNWSPDGVWSDREYCEIPVDRAWVSAWAETEGDVLSAKDLDFTLGMSWDTNYVYTYIAKGLIHRAFPREKRGLRSASAGLFPPGLPSLWRVPPGIPPGSPLWIRVWSEYVAFVEFVHKKRI